MSTYKAWTLTGTGSLDVLELVDRDVSEIGRTDVLIRFKAFSLNYRDIAMALGNYPRHMDKGLISGSDGAGEIVAVGSGVTEFVVGDRVAPCFFQDFLGGRKTAKRLRSALGADREGVFRQEVTAWGCLYGERRVMPGDTVLIQGTGGVSLFGLQFAVAAGATVIATTSSDDKIELLKRLGAKHVVNYKMQPDWGLAARKLTPNGEGFDSILDVGGPTTMGESLKAVKVGGDIHMIGFLGGTEQNTQATIWHARQAFCNLKSVVVGNRVQFEEMNRAIESLGLKPVLDSSTFELKRLKEAYQYVIDAKHVGKVVVDA
ncbi:hypothetical protein H2200_001092 [Cladophialophora chaetospira]|uniref:Enoyl reductase (ER) domain-containing protein n=1 Tax=Cladophialophora chaetospira TaxID=386627 RepID=A0AA38XKC0_9EURO|nr:hypothetical protein H2200_001092 [Cladophialophora chaetospira]